VRSIVFDVVLSLFHFHLRLTVLPCSTLVNLAVSVSHSVKRGSVHSDQHCCGAE